MANVLIVGAGIIGLSAAWALRRDGHRVTVLEQGPIPNPVGTSVDQHRLIRRPYGTEVGYMRMITHAFAAWDAMWRDLGVSLLVRTGSLSLSVRDDDRQAESLRLLKDGGFPVEEMDARRLGECYPLIDPRGVRMAYLSPEGGVLLAERIVMALATWLAENGATLRAGAAVEAIDSDLGSVTLAGGERIESDLVLVAAGAWVGRLVPEMTLLVEPSRQVLAYVRLPDDLARAWATHPSLLSIGADHGFYLVPPVMAPDGTQTALKIGDHLFSRVGDAASDPRLPGEAETKAVYELARGRLRDLDRYVLDRGKVCFYTVDSRDGHETFRSVRLGQAAWAMSNCSGHGFKFAACLGEAFADMVAGRRSAGGFTRYAAGEVL